MEKNIFLLPISKNLGSLLSVNSPDSFGGLGSKSSRATLLKFKVVTGNDLQDF